MKQSTVFLLRFGFLVALVSCLSFFSGRGGDRHTALEAFTTSEPTCRDIHHVKNQCSYFHRYCEEDDGGLISYLDLYYCHFGDARPVALLIIVIWLVLLFTTLSVVAGDFFSVNLSVLARSLNVRDTVAGVTLLALGNGAPDIFSTFAAVTSNSSSMALGELLGAAAFISSVVAGSMALINPFEVVKRALIREASFLLIAVSFLIYVMSDGYLKIWHCIVMLCIYASYVTLVCTWLKFLSLFGIKKETLHRPGYVPVEEAASETTRLLQNESTQQAVVDDDSTLSNVKLTRTTAILQSIRALAPTLHNWQDKSYRERAADILQAPSVLVLRASIPVPLDKHIVDDDEIQADEEIWRRPLFILQCFLGPQFMLFAVGHQIGMSPSHALIPSMCCLAGSVLITIITIFTSTITTAPTWYRFMCVPGFIISIGWISFVADEMVNILTALGIILNISESVLGITVFAIGNSLDDLAADISMAQRKHPVMALSACFGSPLLNILLGISLTGLYALAKQHIQEGTVRHIDLQVKRDLFVTAGLVLGTIVALLSMMMITNWRMTKPVGYILIGIWVVGTIINLAVNNFV